MKIQKIKSGFTFSDKNGINLNFLKNGKLVNITKDSIMINQLKTGEYESPLSNAYIRIYNENNFTTYPIIHGEDNIKTFYTDKGILYKLETENFITTTQYSIENGIIFMTVDVELKNKVQYDIILGQDLGLASEGALMTNEAYACQYIDHKPHRVEDYGWVICSRQNLDQNGLNPFVQIGGLEFLESFSTDGFQFFSKEFKLTNKPQIFKNEFLEDENYQYEFAYIGLKTKKKLKDGKTIFYLNPKSDFSYENKILDIEEIKNSYVAPSSSSEIKQLKNSAPKIKRINTEDLVEGELDKLYPEKKHCEYHDKELISFFTPTGSYITLKEKEALLERPTGHVLLSGNFLEKTEKIISSTNYIYGIFNSQITLGNTSFNKLIGIGRNPLNLQYFSGQRIFIKEDGILNQLSMPTLYEQGYNYSKWLYIYNGNKIEVVSYAASKEGILSLEINSEKEYEFHISNHLIFGNNEDESEILIKKSNNILKITGKNELVNSVYPKLNFIMKLNKEFEVEQPENTPYLILKVSTNSLKLTTSGNLLENIDDVRELDFSTETKLYNETITNSLNGFNLSSTEGELDKVSDISGWYTHNAMVHFLTPHGLEQYSGAAWGTRDVCQGPLEYFLATQNYPIISKILKTIYSHQYIENGTWPQWFMFDKYSFIQQEECHGDIVVWPIKAISDYIKASGDYNILDEEIEYTTIKGEFKFTKSEKLIDHLKKQIKYIKDNLLGNTNLFSYGDGDWDDTLQPKNSNLRKNMVSTWTTTLLIQSLGLLEEVLTKYSIHTSFNEEISEFRISLKKAFEKYSLPGGVVSGFLISEDNEIKPLLHPQDDKTKIKYRLLPMIRGIISETFTKEVAEKHYDIIQDNLMFSDGVRLMTEPVTYQGGKQDYFKRAELATNVGREIGLQYCHAHIRYIEALCKLGKGGEAIENLLKIIPIKLQDNVKNAEYRQSNCYFSSSDAAFKDRYEFKEKFDLLKKGEVKVKGGWRIYSSGPGILLNQIISNILGIRDEGDSIIIDPVLPKGEAIELEYSILGKPVQFKFNILKDEHTPKSIRINGIMIEKINYSNNIYREGGAILRKDHLKGLLNEKSNLIEIEL